MILTLLFPAAPFDIESLTMKFLPLSLLLLPASGFVSVPPPTASASPSFLPATRRPFIAGNWKMNPSTLPDAVSLARSISSSVTPSTPCDVCVFAPMPFIDACRTAAGASGEGSGLDIGAELSFYEEKGAYTGAVSAEMIKSLGVDWVLAGHSERRTMFGDDDEEINKQTLNLLRKGMSVVLCIGETKDEYDAGLVEAVCTLQLKKDLQGVTEEEMERIVIAYEPVWAIGTGLTCPADVAQNVHKVCRNVIRGMYGDNVADAVRIQYGGSVTPETIDELMGMPDIDGALVGGASLVKEKFERIVNFKSV